ncbi:MAG TPA: hypothetical protein VGL06_12390 [Pseudonocardiaceae bacterium]
MVVLLALGQMLFLEAGFAVVQSAWHNHFIGPAGRIGSIVLVALVIGLPWLVHPRVAFGPVAASRAARAVRFGGYALLFVLIPVILAVVGYGNARFGSVAPHGGGGTAVLLSVIFAGYALTILGLTSRRWPVQPETLAVGGGFGVAVGFAVYALMPFGGTLHVPNPELAAVYFVAIPVVALGGPVVAGMMAARRSRQGVAAGVVTAVIAALVITVFSVTTMLLFPQRVTLADDSPGHASGSAYDVRMSVSDTAAGYLMLLLFAPWVGALAGACGSAVGRRREVAMPEPRSGEAPFPLS